MTTATFRHIDTSSYTGKPWSKVDGPGMGFKMQEVQRAVLNLRGREHEFHTDNSGFAVIHRPAQEKTFTDEHAVRDGYYSEVEALLRAHLPPTPGSSRIRKVHIYDHTIRRRLPSSPRQPVQQVHVDQTRGAAEARVRRHLPAAEAEELLQRRFQIINVWRPIAYPAQDCPVGVVDWRTTAAEDYVPVDLMYPRRPESAVAGGHGGGEGDDDDDRGKERLPDESSLFTTEGYEARGETLAVAPNEKHRFCYVKDMTPDEVMLLKCYDSFGDGEPQGRSGLAARAPHTAFTDPETPADAPPRQSIEVRCLVFYE